MKRWLYYHRLAWLDLVRLGATTQHHVIIVAGICLPVLLLFGLKQGHVAELRKDLLTSPTGRQVIFWSAQRGELMGRAAIARLARELPHVDLVIPELQRVVNLASSHDRAAENITLFATRPGDPVLAKVRCDVLRAGEHGAVLSRPVARALHVGVNDAVTVTVFRGRGAIKETAAATLTVRAILPGSGQESRIAYVDANVLDRMEQFVRGFRVEEFHWPALKAAARDLYPSYLVFCERPNCLTQQDQETLRERGFSITPLEIERVPVLGRLLRAGAASGLSVYEIAAPASKHDAKRRLGHAPSELAHLTEADDVVVPWSEPCEVDAGAAQRAVLVGLSLPRRCWLRSYLRSADLAFDYEADALSERRASAGSAPVPTTIRIPLPGAASLAIEMQAAPKPMPAQAGEPASGPMLAVVPVNLLAHLSAVAAGTAEFDPATRLFVPVAEEPVYDKARLYARGIDDVPGVVEALRQRGFAVMSESGRITEIQQQDRSLRLLVAIVVAGVFCFGVIVVVSVLLDSTDRKRGTIGVLRVMGVSAAGIFYVVLLRATAIGLMAGAVSVGTGYAIAVGLAWTPPPGTWLAVWKPVVHMVVARETVLPLIAGALVCCSIGALIPAWRAGRLDPFDAIVEGRFH